MPITSAADDIFIIFPKQIRLVVYEEMSSLILSGALIKG